MHRFRSLRSIANHVHLMQHRNQLDDLQRNVHQVAIRGADLSLKMKQQPYEFGCASIPRRLVGAWQHRQMGIQSYLHTMPEIVCRVCHNASAQI